DAAVRTDHPAELDALPVGRSRQVDHRVDVGRGSRRSGGKSGPGLAAVKRIGTGSALDDTGVITAAGKAAARGDDVLISAAVHGRVTDLEHHTVKGIFKIEDILEAQLGGC